MDKVERFCLDESGTSQVQHALLLALFHVGRGSRKFNLAATRVATSGAPRLSGLDRVREISPPDRPPRRRLAWEE